MPNRLSTIAASIHFDHTRIFRRPVNHSLSVIVFTVAVLLCGLPAKTSFAQQTSGEIVGRITDVDKANVPNATVTVRNLETNQSKTVVTGNGGDYTFTALNPGTYQISVTAPGFKAFEIDTIQIAAGDHFRANAEMKIGASSEVVSVSADASSLQTESSAVNTTLTERAVQDLPLNGRNFIGLVLLTPGASEGTPDSPASGTIPADRRQTSSISVNGQSADTNQHLIDGMDNIERIVGLIGVRPSIDAIAEVQVQTNTYTAEVGRTAGGVINVVTKAGTNKVHGSIYEFFRNDTLDAYPFAFGVALPKAELRQNQYGGSVGGPVKKDKLFFFGDYEEERRVAGTAPLSLVVPTLYEKQHPGDFSDTGGPVVTGAALDKAGAAYLGLLPAPNNGATTYTGVGKGTYYARTIDGRGDYQLTPRDLIFARYTYNHVAVLVPSTFPAGMYNGLTVTPEQPGQGPATDNAQNALLSYQRIIKPNLLFEGKASYLFINNGSFNFNVGVNPNTAFGQANINIDPSTSGLAYVRISGNNTRIGSGALQLPSQEHDNTYELLGALTYTKGANSLKFGATAIRRDVYQNGQAAGEGNFVFASFITLAQGKPATVSRNYNFFPEYLRTYETSGFFQDDWHVRKDLTVNIGLRYDVFTPFTEGKNRISNFDEFNAKVVVAGLNGTNRYAGLKNDFRNLAPRLGFAYNPIAGTVVHGGFGMIYYPGTINTNGILKNLPFNYSYGPCSESLGTCPAGFNNFSAGLPLPVAGDPTNPVGGLSTTVNTDAKSTAVAQYNMYVQQAFGANVVSIGYVGMSGRHVLAVLPDINAAPPNLCGGAGNVCYNSLRPYYSRLPNVTNITQLKTAATSSYNSLQTSFDRRASRGLTLGATYTWAHDIDNSGTPGNGTKIDSYGSMPLIFRSFDRGNSNYDARSRVSARINYLLPFGSKYTGLRGTLVKGWQTNLIYVWSTGLPFTVVNSSSISDTVTTGVDRPLQLGNNFGVSTPSIAQFFNACYLDAKGVQHACTGGATPAFQIQAAGVQGTERRDQLYGPHYRHLDMSLFKTFALTERYHLEFRAEGFNVANQANFALPNAIIGNATFGTITALSNSYAPRQVQLALKLNF